MECVDTLFDDFSVDELLDLSNAEGILKEETPTEEDEQLRQKHTSFSDHIALVSSTEGFFPVTGGDLDFPVDELAELEWLSKFIEDSFSEANLTSDFPVKPNSLSVNHDSPTVESVATKKPFFRTTVPAKARSKRHRAGGRVWYREYPSGNERSASSSSSSSSGPLKASLCGAVASSQTPETARGKRKRKPVGSGGGRGANQPRRCSHCGVQKTPQWRMGPSGAKTLCNACGVRFKSGRLLPEYRPASSPTFSGELHSNSHRKVMELRRKKEVFQRVGLNLV